MNIQLERDKIFKDISSNIDRIVNMCITYSSKYRGDETREIYLGIDPDKYLATIFISDRVEKLREVYKINKNKLELIEKIHINGRSN